MKSQKLSKLKFSKIAATVSSTLLMAFSPAALATADAGVQSQAAQYQQQELAGIVEGTYRDAASNLDVIVKKEVSRYAVNFYAIMNSGANKTGLFKIDAIDASTLALTQINMGAQNILKTNNESQPSYSAQVITINGKSTLILSATATGSANGCPQAARLTLDNNSSETWVSLSDITVQKLKINRDAEIDLVMTGRGPLKEYSMTILGGDDLRASWSGQYLVREQIAGVGLMRKRQLDSMKESGFALTRHSSATLVSMKSKNNKPVIKLVQLQAGSNSCLSSSSNIK